MKNIAYAVRDEMDYTEHPKHDTSHNAIYLGGLSRNRICYDHFGRKMKVRHVGEGSVTVTRSGRMKVIKDKAFRTRERITLAKASVVYLTKPEKMEVTP